MDRRRAQRTLTVGCVLIALATGLTGCGRQEHAPALEPGQNAPALLGGSEERARVTWIVRPPHLLDCDPGIDLLRHVQRRFGDSVELVMIVVGHTETAPALLRRERLTVRLESATEAELRSALGSEVLPAVVLTSQGRIAGIWSSRRTAIDVAAGADGERLPDIIARLVARNTIRRTALPDAHHSTMEASHARKTENARAGNRGAAAQRQSGGASGG
jgi:hypothetical protein